MELFSALLTVASSFFLAVSITLHTWVGGALSENPVVTILPPVPIVEIDVAPSSAQNIFGTAPSKEIALVPKKNPDDAVVTAVSTPLTTGKPLPMQTLTADALNTQTRLGVVNILCAVANSSEVHSISGSGVFIDSRGVILTNAHVGQYFLLKDYPAKNNIDCVIRTGNPAQPKYRATLLYLPPSWVNTNAAQLIAQQAKGTGEDDYAFLLINSSTGPTPLPISFPALAMTTAEPNTKDSAFLAAYAAGFLNGLTIQKDLYQTSAYATVKDLYTFGKGNDIDLVSIGGTVVSQGGSSGGATVRTSDGKLEGIISTATAGDTTAERDLRAITIAHIERSLIKNGQRGIAELLQQNIVDAAARFNATTATTERNTLIKAIEFN